MTYAVLVDSVDGMVNRQEVLDKLDRVLVAQAPGFVDRSTFGTDEMARQSSEAMHKVVGGPAPMRSSS